MIQALSRGVGINGKMNVRRPGDASVFRWLRSEPAYLARRRGECWENPASAICFVSHATASSP